MEKMNWHQIASRVILGTLIVVVVGASLWLRSHDLPATGSVQQSVIATPAPEVKHDTPTPQPVKTKTVRAYSQESKARLKLPPLITDDPNQLLIAASTAPSSDHPQTISTVMDSSTGGFKTYIKEEPLPLLAWNFHGDAGMFVGAKNGERAARLEVRQGVFDVKAAHFGVIASADQPLNGPLKADYFVGAGVWARW